MASYPQYRNRRRKKSRWRGFLAKLGVLLFLALAAWPITALLTGQWWPQREQKEYEAGYAGIAQAQLAPLPQDPSTAAAQPAPEAPPEDSAAPNDGQLEQND